jgi:uncharacterized hydrophobic protein (TIGR00341 family)
MPQRVVKIIVPAKYGTQALEVLHDQEHLSFWQEEATGGNFVASALLDSGRSETIMDLFERRFAAVEGFNLILFPVEAALPRVESAEPVSGEALPNSRAEKQKVPGRISREELYSDIVDSTNLSTFFIFMTVLSTVVAAIGLLKNNVAVIIGAMVIAPFLGPNVALALSTNLADRQLGFNALRTASAGAFIVLLLSAGLGFVFKANPTIPEIASRTRADLSDIILALASGCAGVLAFTTGASSAVIGVMVAVALLPPLTVCGLLLGAGQFPLALGAFLLFMTNIICINLAGVFTFLIQGISPRDWWEADRAKKATRKALMLWTAILVVLAITLFFWQTHY